MPTLTAAAARAQAAAATAVTGLQPVPDALAQLDAEMAAAESQPEVTGAAAETLAWLTCAAAPQAQTEAEAG